MFRILMPMDTVGNPSRGGLDIMLMAHHTVKTHSCSIMHGIVWRIDCCSGARNRNMHACMHDTASDCGRVS